MDVARVAAPTEMELLMKAADEMGKAVMRLERRQGQENDGGRMTKWPTKLRLWPDGTIQA